MGKMTPLALATLGLLGERPHHPYEIAFVMRQRHMDKHIRLNMGTLYHTFEQLQRAGWIESTETERPGRRPERTVYALTSTGRERFQDRLRELISVPTGEYSSFEAGLSFMHELPRNEAVELLRMRALALEQQLDVGVQILSWLRARGLTRLSLIEVEMAHEQRKWQLEWVRRVTGEIESGELEWSAGFSDHVDKSSDEKKVPDWITGIQEEVP